VPQKYLIHHIKIRYIKPTNAKIAIRDNPEVGLQHCKAKGMWLLQIPNN
jgi:hypothetical protein